MKAQKDRKNGSDEHQSKDCKKHENINFDLIRKNRRHTEPTTNHQQVNEVYRKTLWSNRVKIPKVPQPILDGPSKNKDVQVKP